MIERTGDCLSAEVLIPERPGRGQKQLADDNSNNNSDQIAVSTSNPLHCVAGNALART